MSLDAKALGKSMVAAASGVLDKKWKTARPYAEAEFAKLADTLKFIEKEVLALRMTPRKAAIHLEIQKEAAATVLLTIQGLSTLAVEEAINAALGVVRETVNAALRFPLL